MFGLLFALFLMIAAAALFTRRRREPDHGDEPWRASLREEDDEPLDLEEIRRAEEEWAAESEAEGGWEEDDDEPWRG
jgi:hypothetical protein